MRGSQDGEVCMAGRPYSEVLRGIEPRLLAVPSCALGLFFVWFETAFPMSANDAAAQTAGSGWLSVVAFDGGWLAALVTFAVGTAVVGGWMRLRRGGGPGLRNLVRACCASGVVGCLLMACGSAFVALAASGGALGVVGGALAGAGMLALVMSWLPACALYDETDVLLMVVTSVLVSILVMCVLAIVDAAFVTVALVLLPVIAEACALLAMRDTLVREPLGADGSARAGGLGRRRVVACGRDAVLRAAVDVVRTGSSGSSGPSSSPTSAGPDARPGAGAGEALVTRPFFNAQSTMILVAFFAVFFVLAVIGPRVDMTLTSTTYWLVNVAGVANMVLLLVVMRFLGPTRLRSAFVILLATTIAAMPLLLLFADADVCFVLVKFATFNAYGLTMLYLGPLRSSEMSAGRHYAQSLLLLALLAGVTVIGTLLGDIVQGVFAHDALGSAVVAVVLLYVVLVVFVLSSSRSAGKVLHVITGTFDDEAQIAQVRCDVICEAHPELSQREREVLLLLLRNYSTPRIAERLVISENTAKTHVRHVYAKVGVGSRQQLLALAERVEVHAGSRSRG